jgi:cytochrome c oxidase cbb3-type subunit 1
MSTANCATASGLLWLSLDEYGELRYSFRDIMASMPPYYLLRLVAGLVFLAGAGLLAYNLFRTIAGAKTIQVRPPAVHDAGASA